MQFWVQITEFTSQHKIEACRLSGKPAIGNMFWESPPVPCRSTAEAKLVPCYLWLWQRLPKTNPHKKGCDVLRCTFAQSFRRARVKLHAELLNCFAELCSNDYCKGASDGLHREAAEAETICTGYVWPQVGHIRITSGFNIWPPYGPMASYGWP